MNIFGTFRDGLSDLSAGLARRAVWLELAREDIDDSHRRTWLGPAWLVLNFLFFLGTLVVIFGGSSDNFIAYLACGLLVWLYANEVISQAVGVFTHNESFIKGTTLPLSVYVLRLSARSLLRSSFALLGAAIVLLAFADPPGWAVLTVPAALAVLVVATPAIVIVAGIAGVYFPDMQFVVGHVLRIMMFLTPIFWLPGGGGLRQALYTLNPLTHFIEIVRQPLYADVVPTQSWAVVAAVVATLWVLALHLLGRHRHNLVFVI